MRVLLIALLLVACSKADEPAAKPKPEGATAAELSTFETKSLAMLDKIVDIFTKDGNDCEKLATDLQAYVAQNKPTFQEIKDLALKQSAAQKKELASKVMDRSLGLVTKMALATQACGKSPAVIEALKKIRP